jgi:hypothetical protein
VGAVENIPWRARSWISGSATVRHGPKAVRGDAEVVDVLDQRMDRDGRGMDALAANPAVRAESGAGLPFCLAPEVQYGSVGNGATRDTYCGRWVRNHALALPAVKVRKYRGRGVRPPVLRPQRRDRYRRSNARDETRRRGEAEQVHRSFRLVRPACLCHPANLPRQAAEDHGHCPHDARTGLVRRRAAPFRKRFARRRMVRRNPPFSLVYKTLAARIGRAVRDVGKVCRRRSRPAYADAADELLEPFLAS